MLKLIIVGREVRNMPEKKTGTGLPVNLAAALSYVLGWITGIVFLLIEKDRFVRFHALQSILVFGILTVLTLVPLVGWILSPVIWIVGFVLWLVLIYKAYEGEEFKLPWVGEFAKKQLEKMK
jgi:uncharacterized membrane protein